MSVKMKKLILILFITNKNVFKFTHPIPFRYYFLNLELFHCKIFLSIHRSFQIEFSFDYCARSFSQLTFCTLALSHSNY